MNKVEEKVTVYTLKATPTVKTHQTISSKLSGLQYKSQTK